MSRFKYGMALLAVVTAGCAGAPEQTAGSGAPAGSPLVAAQGEQASEESLESLESLETIALTERDADRSAEVVCRDMLQMGSNVIVTRCMTREDWDRFERAQTLHAQQFLRALQGDAFPR